MKFPLTANLIKLISKRDRVALGLRTQDELAAAAAVKTEKELHRHIGNLLRLRGIEFFESRMDRKSTMKIGTPDFLFCVAFKPRPDNTTKSLLTWPIAIGWEIKMPGKDLDPEQAAMAERMSSAPNGWRCQVIHSVDEAIAELRKLRL